MWKLMPALYFIGLMAVPVAGEDYKLGPDSMVKDGVPQGTVTSGKWLSEKVFPGTERDYWVYVPAQYKKEKPACVMVFQDGKSYVDPKGSFVRRPCSTI